MKKEYYYGILPLALTSCLVSQTSAQERQINRPNVVFIYADDIGYGDLSCNGAKTIHTPNVERFGKDGSTFLQMRIVLPLQVRLPVMLC